jgi:hypothetical protein
VRDQGPVGPNSTFSDLDYVGVANVAPGDMRLWAHLGSVYVVSAVALLVSARAGGAA